MAAGTRLDLAGLLFAVGALTGCSAAVDAPSRAVDADTDEIAGTGEVDDDRVLLFGDTHLHTRNSVDAFATGVASTDIDTAYRFARGEPVVFPKTGQRVQIDRPLDFTVVADHAENLSIAPRIEAGDPAVLATELGAKFRSILEKSGARAMTIALMGFDQSEANRPAYFAELMQSEIRQSSWDAQIAAAEKYNQPGVFSAMIGWEWSSTPNTRNLHRIVMTNVDGAVARQFLPFNYYQSDKPEGLWRFFEETKARTGADFIGMPHNSNLSDGLMFATTDSSGEPFTAAYAQRRASWEPVAEVSQYKGTSETHPALSPNDEFAGFELRNMLLSGEKTEAKDGSYLRRALLLGLAEEVRIGVNPFHYGMIGASDSHTGLSAQQENSFYGKMAEDFLPSERFGPNMVRSTFPNAEMSAGGLAGVWADTNDRQSIFEAFRRREVYATTGPRMSVRLFAGYGLPADMAQARDFAAQGYRRGVPMGGNLLPSDGRAPQFAIRAVKDATGANLDRVQVIKGWIDTAGKTHERVFDVAWSGNRRKGADGKLPPVGSTVDLKTARYTNGIGAAELATVWTDPEFDPRQAAFYYVRVLEIPTPRQHLFDALALGIDPATIDISPTIQERAWSSPVWYRP